MTVTTGRRLPVSILREELTVQAARRRFLSELIVFVLVISSLVMPFQASAAAGPISYVSIGDSIATGTVDYWSSITPYVDYFYGFLVDKHAGTEVTLTRLAHDGDRSDELLAKLQTDEMFRTAVGSAEVLTISMGGNNLMQAAAIPGFTDIDWALAEEGAQHFEAQWATIMGTIRGLNGSAKIIVMTVYNPYNESPAWLFREDSGLFAATEPYLARINGLIADAAATYDYAIADAHLAFLAYQPSSMGSVTYMYPKWYQYLYRNPHPTALGQQLITGLHTAAYDSIVDPPPISYFTIATAVNPPGFGTTAGDGEYAQGESATVSAAALTGYQFVNWTENGAPVSTEAAYSFVVTADRTLVANFAETSPPPTRTASVSAISYSKIGPHIGIIISVADESTSPVAGAAVTATLYLNGDLVAEFSATTDSTGVGTYKYTKAPSGTYHLTITAIQAAGYEWDGITPDNAYTKK